MPGLHLGDTLCDTEQLMIDQPAADLEITVVGADEDDAA